MSDPRTKPRWGWWIATSLVMCLVAAALRVGLPIYRRNSALAMAQRFNFRIITFPQTPNWLSRHVSWGWTSGFESVFQVFNSDPDNKLTRRQTLELLSQIRVLGELKELGLYGADLNDADLTVLECFPTLKFLDLRSTSITDDGLKYLVGSSNLQILWLTETQIDDAGLEHIATLTKLETLHLDRTRVSNAGLKHLAKLPNLRELTVSNTAVTDAGLDELLKTHTTLSVSDD